MEPRNSSADAPTSVRVIQVAIESLVLLLVGLSPWAFGATEPVFEFFLFCGVAVLLALWAARILLERELVWKRCRVTLCLAGIFALGFYQLTPLPGSVLALLSPATARLYGELLPASSEIVDGDDGSSVAATTGTLSLYPGATFRELVRWLAVIALFAVVRNNIDPLRGLKRLSVFALVNGTLLAFVGFLQRFSSPTNMIYWSFSSHGTVFGPFINRNHFAFYINLCIGLGLGLLLYAGDRSGNRRKGANSDPLAEDAPRKRRRRRRHVRPRHLAQALRSYIRRPRVLWVGTAIAFLVAAIAFSLSRGGMLALACALAVFALLCLRRPVYTAMCALVVGLAVTLGLWLGPQPVEDRLATLADARALQASRLQLWKNALPLAAEFPLWGTGYGTFAVVEPMHRDSMQGAGLVAEHAENEYLEALVEGGIVRLLLTLLVIGFVGYLGYQALCRQPFGSPRWGLLLGGLVAFITVVIHSFVDFGVHTPAVAVLATVICAYLVGAGDAKEPSMPVAYHLRGAAPILSALAMLSIGWLLCHDGYQEASVNRYRVIAHRQRSDEEEAGLRRIAYLEEAARGGPGFARVYAELGEAHGDFFEQQQQRLKLNNKLRHIAREVLAYAPLFPAATPEQSIASAVLGNAISDQKLAADVAELHKQHIVPGLRAFLRARDLCPLLPQPHVRIALHVGSLEKADARGVYLERAHRVMPFDPELLYVSGLLNLLDGDIDQAIPTWKRSLRMSSEFLPSMIANCRSLPDPYTVLAGILPDDPAYWIDAGLRLYPAVDAVGQRKPYLDRALEMLARMGKPGGAQLRLQGLALFGLGKVEAGTNAYREALAKNAQHPEWRYELVAQLLQHGATLEASSELRLAVQEKPSPQARKLRELIERRLAGQE